MDIKQLKCLPFIMVPPKLHILISDVLLSHIIYLFHILRMCDHTYSALVVNLHRLMLVFLLLGTVRKL